MSHGGIHCVKVGESGSCRGPARGTAGPVPTGTMGSTSTSTSIMALEIGNVTEDLEANNHKTAAQLFPDLDIESLI